MPRAHPPRDARGFTIGELLIVIVIIMVIGAIATAILQRARLAGNESSAIASMRAIVSGQAAYIALNQGYAGNIEALAALCPGMSAAFISPELTHNGQVKDGYVVQTAPGQNALTVKRDCQSRNTYTKFYASAVPETVGHTGHRAFAANTTAAVWQNTNGTAPPEPFVKSSTVTVIGSNP